MEKVHIRCFRTPGGNYFYDRFTDSVVGVTEQEYTKLLQVEKQQKVSSDSSLKRFIDNGLLQEASVSKIEHPETYNIKYLTECRLEDLILQVTQQCNLRCGYCAYSGNYYNREHSNQRMSWDIAKKAIDFYLQRSKESEKLCLSFYGGEPLLEWSLIQQSVQYILEQKGDQPISFHMTTNATLLTKEKLDFLIKHKFHLLISLDGAKESHDANRKFASGEGSFDVIYKNLLYLKELKGAYYKENVMFNAVMSVENDLNSTLDFFANEEIFYTDAIALNTVEPSNLKNKALINRTLNENQIAEDFEYLKMLLCLIGRRKWDPKSKLLRRDAADMELLYQHMHRHSMESERMHPNGPCLAGVRRLFVNASGKFFPCERVSESNESMCIGSLQEGYNYERIDNYINHGKKVEEECINCWNLRRCLFCIASVDKQDGSVTKADILKQCIKSKKRSMVLIYNLCVLVELGYRGNDNLKLLK